MSVSVFCVVCLSLLTCVDVVCFSLSLCCSNFAIAFQTAALDTKAQFSMDGFDSNVMLIRQDDLHRFTEYLQHELAGDDDDIDDDL